MRIFPLLLIALSLQAGEGTHVLVLGTAQDGGLPQIGCREARCEAARERPERRRLVASLAIIGRGKRWLIDASPDLPEQVALLGPHGDQQMRDGRRPKIFDGIFLTHAHMGHYTGLLQLGPEAYNHQTIPLYGSARMLDYLQKNGPWSLLFQNKNLAPVVLEPDKPLALDDEITITPFVVPHREEFSDTLGYIIRGPEQALLYIPDIDKWSRWAVAVEEKIAQVDYALLDGTFFADGEIPGRPMAEIPHPFIQESIERFQKLPKTERLKIHFTHLNHTNPACDFGGEAQQSLGKHDFRVVADGEIFGL